MLEETLVNDRRSYWILRTQSVRKPEDGIACQKECGFARSVCGARDVEVAFADGGLAFRLTVRLTIGDTPWSTS